MFGVSPSPTSFLRRHLKNLVSSLELLLRPSAINFRLTVELRKTHRTSTSILYAKLFLDLKYLILLLLVAPLHFSDDLFNFCNQTTLFFHRQLIQFGPYSFCVHVLTLHQFCEVLNSLFALVLEVLLQLFCTLILIISFKLNLRLFNDFF